MASLFLSFSMATGSGSANKRALIGLISLLFCFVCLERRERAFLLFFFKINIKKEKQKEPIHSLRSLTAMTRCAIDLLPVIARCQPSLPI